MKIAVDGSVFAPPLTGIGNYSLNLMLETAKIRPDFTFIVFLDENIEIDSSWTRQNIVWMKPKNDWNNKKYWKLLKLATLVNKSDSNVFWSTSGTPPFGMKKPTILTVYDFVYRLFPKTMTINARLFRKLSQPYWIKRAAAVFTISKSVSDEMKAYYGREADAIIYPAVNEAFYKRDDVEIQSVKKKYQLPDEYGLIVGTMEPRKNLYTFLRAYIDVVRGNKLPILVIAGHPGWKSKKVKEIIAEGTRKGIVQALGYVGVEDLPALYSGAEIFCMPSLYEGFGMPIIEARQCGTPVVCSQVDAMKEAGGDSAQYFVPTYDGIRKTLEVCMQNVIVPQPIVWSWLSEAQKFSRLLDSVSLGK